MKNSYPKILLEEAFESYEILKRNRIYKGIYAGLKSVHTIYHKYLIRSKLPQDKLDEFILFEHNLKRTIRVKWGLNFAIEPNLEITHEDLKKPIIKPGSPLANLIYAYGLDNNTDLLGIRKKGPKKKRESSQDLREKKFYAHCLYKSKRYRVSLRKLGRTFGVDHHTVRRWVDEVEGWSLSKRETVCRQYLTAKTSKGGDFYKLPWWKRDVLEDVEHKLTNDGVLHDGKKRIPSPKFQYDGAPIEVN